LLPSHNRIQLALHHHKVEWRRLSNAYEPSQEKKLQKKFLILAQISQDDVGNQSTTAKH
jgi:hypothetical protein